MPQGAIARKNCYPAVRTDRSSSCKIRRAVCFRERDDRSKTLFGYGGRDRRLTTIATSTATCCVYSKYGVWPG
jgi:hypothetical protein